MNYETKTHRTAVIHEDYPAWLKEKARILIWRVHKNDNLWKEPFKNDEDYDNYLFDIERDLHDIVSETLKRQGMTI